MSEHERNIAIREAEHIAASDAYFDARHRSIDTLLSRSAFEGGFCRAWDVLSARVAELDSKAFAVGQVLGRAGFKPEDMSNPAKCIEAIMQNAEKFMAERDAARAALAKREAVAVPEGDLIEKIVEYGDHRENEGGSYATFQKSEARRHRAEADAVLGEIRALLAKREAVAGGVVWQARARGCSEWSDVGAEHAERLRTCSWLVRAVVVVSPESDIPIAERAMLAASQQPASVPEADTEERWTEYAARRRAEIAADRASKKEG